MLVYDVTNDLHSLCVSVDKQAQVQGTHVQQSDILRPLWLSSLWTPSPGNQVRLWVHFSSLLLLHFQGSGPVFYLLLGVSSGCAQPITGQVTSVTWPVIGWAEYELTRSKRQKAGPGWTGHLMVIFSHGSGQGTVAVLLPGFAINW